MNHDLHNVTERERERERERVDKEKNSAQKDN